MANTKPLHQARFEAAVNVIQSLPKNGSFQPSNEMMLKFYSFYKQATQGPCNIQRPGFWDPVSRYKWDAWNSLGDMSKKDAMIAYVDEMKKIIETMPMTEKVEELLQVIGPFYEIVEDRKRGGDSGAASVRLDKVAKSLEDLSSALTSTPILKAVNGNAESSDSGADSEGEENGQQEDDDDEDGEEDKLSEREEKAVKKEVTPEPCPDTAATNGLHVNHNDYIPDIPNHVPNKSDLNENIMEMNGKPKTIQDDPLKDCSPIKDDGTDIAAIQHLTSDSDSEIFCDTMEQFGHEDVDHSLLVENAMRGTALKTELEGLRDSGEAKEGGEDGASGRRPRKEKSENFKEEYSGSRRGKTNPKSPVGHGSHGGQSGNGGDGEQGRAERGPEININEPIEVTLLALQKDMQDVHKRLDALETTAQLISSWWPRETPAGSSGILVFAIIWPFVAHWLIRLYLQRKRR